MQELLTALTSKVPGLSAEQAQHAVNAVLEFVKSKVPAPVATQVENVFNGHEFSVTDIVKGEASDKLEDLKDAASDKFDDLKEGAKGLMNKLGL